MQFIKNIYHFFVAWISAVRFGHPSRTLTVIGITGTKGKTTTVELLAHILKAGGMRVAFLSSAHEGVRNDIKKNNTGNSMPGRGYLQSFLRHARRAGCTHAVLEVTSQGVMQSRHAFIDWDVAVFLNLHPEHIEAHGSYENYLESKVAFFENVERYSVKNNKMFFINSGNKEAGTFEAAINITPMFFSRDIFVREWLGGDVGRLGELFSNDANLENAAAAAAIAEQYGVSREKIIAAIRSFQGVAGRFEWIQREPFGVVADYAHTPDSLRGLYQALRETCEQRQATGKLICVLGAAGGGRDRWKRPEFGKIAAEYCDEIILTDEDPYDENPLDIAMQIESGISLVPSPYTLVPMIILDRKAAIEKAISLARPGDTVVMTGKGSEEWIHGAKGTKIPWSESEIAREAIEKSLSFELVEKQ